MLLGFAVILGSLLLGCFAAWMSSRANDEDTLAKIVWGGMMVTCLAGMAAGGLSCLSAYRTQYMKKPEPAPVSAPRAPKTGPISIKVTDQYTTTPMPSVIVRITFAGSPNEVTAITDANGLATFEDQPYRVGAKVSAAATDGSGRTATGEFSGGFEPGASPVVPMPALPGGRPGATTPGNANPGGNRPVPDNPDPDNPPPTNPAPVECSLSGAVTDSTTGTAATTGVVTVYDLDGNPITSAGVNQGRYEIPRIAPGTYDIKFSLMDREVTKRLEMSSGPYSLDAEL